MPIGSPSAARHGVSGPPSTPARNAPDDNPESQERTLLGDASAALAELRPVRRVVALTAGLVSARGASGACSGRSSAGGGRCVAEVLLGLVRLCWLAAPLSDLRRPQAMKSRYLGRSLIGMYPDSAVPLGTVRCCPGNGWKRDCMAALAFDGRSEAVAEHAVVAFPSILRLPDACRNTSPEMECCQ